MKLRYLLNLWVKNYRIFFKFKMIMFLTKSSNIRLLISIRSLNKLKISKLAEIHWILLKNTIIILMLRLLRLYL